MVLGIASPPIMNAAGTLSYENIHHVTSVYGALVTKTITLDPILGNPPPRLVETPCGMINSIGLQNPGVDKFLEEEIYKWDVGLPIIVSVEPPSSTGDANEDARRSNMYKRIGHHPLVHALEVNMSCPNIPRPVYHSYYKGWFEDDGHVFNHVKNVAYMVPVGLKLGIHSLMSRVEEACRAKVDFLTLINTIPAVGFIGSLPVLGGLSGPAINPIALRAVLDVRQRYDVPIIACGGIVSQEDINHFMEVGADAVQIGSGSFVADPTTYTKVL